MLVRKFTMGLLTMDLYRVRWIDRAMWALDVLPLDSTGLDRVTSREIQKSGQLIIQWEFSLAATLMIVARSLLATILEKIQLSVVVAKDAQETKQRSRG